MKAKQKLTECKTALLLHCPFFASLLMDMTIIKLGKFPHIFPPENETMATNGKLIWIDEDYLESLKLPEAVFCLCHEVGHCMWMHMPRGKYYTDNGFDGKLFNARLWNIASDYIVNDLLIEAGIGTMPAGGLHDRSIATGNDLADDVYRRMFNVLLSKHPPPQGRGKDNGLEGGGTLDTHVIDGTRTDSEIEWKRAVKTAVYAAKAQDNLPGNLERLAQNWLQPQIPWIEKLRFVFSRKIGRDASDWSRLHRRRYIMQGVLMPRYKSYGAGVVVFCVDTSGSMQDDEIRQGLSECDSLLTDCNPERVILIGCDAAVSSVHELGPGDTLANTPPACTLSGGGGTSFVPPFKWLQERGIRPDCLVYFTDTMGYFPTWEPGFPVIWCSTATNVKIPDKAPGEIVYVEITNE